MTQRIALVTGGMGGLGEAICMKLARMGIKVVVTYSPGNTKYKDWLKDMEGRDYHFHAYRLRRVRLRLVRSSGREGLHGDRPDRHPHQQRRHHARHDLQEDGQGRLGRGDEDQPRQRLQHDQAGGRRAWSSAAGAA